jgi:hypothetical protein
MEAAKEDPLRAQEIEAGLNGKWFNRYIAWIDIKGQSIKKEHDKLKRERERVSRKAKRSR